MPELRRDKLTGTWVVVAEGRRGRPRDFGLRSERAAAKGPCPFCPGNEAMTPPETFALRAPDGAPDGPGWRVRVVPNKFPALGGPGAPVPVGHVLQRMAGVGAHEVVIETPDHGQRLRARSPQAWADVALALQHRLRALAADPRMRYVLAFKNQGPASGASLEHPHAQVVAMPVVPERVEREVQAFEDHHRLAQRCLLEDLLAEEREAKVRVVEDDGAFTLVAPFAGRVPYELLLAPRAHGPRFEDAPPEQAAAFGQALGRALGRLERILEGHPVESYHFGIHTAPARGNPERYHWHAEVMPSLAFHAAFEKTTGMYLNHLPPEEAAAQLRGA